MEDLKETKQRDVFFGSFSIFPDGGRQARTTKGAAMNIQPKGFAFIKTTREKGSFIHAARIIACIYLHFSYF